MNDQPPTSAEEMLQRLAPVLSRGRRLRGVGALLTGLAGASFTTVLWATEPDALPDRTHLSFALLLLICLAWTGYGIWSTTRRAPLFALDRVIAGWLALAAALLTTTITITLAAVRDQGVVLALAMSTILITLAGLLLARARARRAALLRRKADLTESGPH
ncbi:hypothetical protein GCM10010191_22100 [Actinomadura vinacea]|uniref:Transmembrane transport protein n=1 Tax=Actinomadura vinacea TaxID=115336 RepID=A0ABP5VUL0_9ACTN